MHAKTYFLVKQQPLALGEMVRTKILSCLAAAVIMLALVVPSPASAVEGGPDPPTNVHLTWKTADTARTITVIWQTSNENAGITVWYDTTSHEENLLAYENASGNVNLSPDGVNYIHEVELTVLSTDTLYYFRCGGENGGHSQEWSFRTAPTTSSKSFTFVVGGDSRNWGSWDPSPRPNWPEERNDISREMAKFNPSFVIFTGDFVRDWDNQLEWGNWFSSMQEYWVTSENRMIPIIPCIGNHEIAYPQPSDYNPLEDASYYYKQFSLPGNERWYSLDWGPSIHIIILDSEILSTESENWNEQLAWLENDLIEHENFHWKLVAFHRPPFSSDKKHGSEDRLREPWCKLFDQYHVDLVINGHAHLYERTHPINYTASSSEPQQTSDDGTVYVVSGGWGAPLYEPGEKWWTAHSAKGHHFLLLNLSSADGALRLRAIDDEGNAFDEITLPYQRPGAVSELLLIAIAAFVVVLLSIIIYMRKKKRPPAPGPAPAQLPPTEPPTQKFSGAAGGIRTRVASLASSCPNQARLLPHAEKLSILQLNVFLTLNR